MAAKKNDTYKCYASGKTNRHICFLLAAQGARICTGTINMNCPKCHMINVVRDMIITRGDLVPAFRGVHATLLGPQHLRDELREMYYLAATVTIKAERYSYRMKDRYGSPGYIT